LIPTQELLNKNTVAKRVDADKAYFVDLADIHLGSLQHNRKPLMGIVDLIKETPNFFWLGGGDTTENAKIGGKSSVFDESTHGIDQLLELRDILRPIKDKCIGIKSGNHGLSRAYKTDKLPPEQILAELLGAKFIRGIPHTLINVRKNLYAISAIHTTIKQNEKFDWLNSDVIIGEHLHIKTAERLPIAYLNRIEKKWSVRPRLYMKSGSFLSWGGYAEEKYRPLDSQGGYILELSGIANDWDIRIIERLRDFK